jgi:RHS repeat-associated protein
VTGVLNYQNHEWEVVERYTYSAYGKATIYDMGWSVRTSSLYKNTTLYTGRELDLATGLYYYRARYYSASLGSFVNRDPIGYLAGDMNLYGYCSSMPLFQTDPSGTCKCGECKVSNVSYEFPVFEITCNDNVGSANSPIPIPLGDLGYNMSSIMSKPWSHLETILDRKKLIDFLKEHNAPGTIMEFHISIKMKRNYSITKCNKDGEWETTSTQRSAEGSDTVGSSNTFNWVIYGNDHGEVDRINLAGAVTDALHRIGETIKRQIFEQMKKSDPDCKRFVQ